MVGAEVAWPHDALFENGEFVEREDMSNGKPPPYRFPGRICGWYRNPVTGRLGFAVSYRFEPGCIQVFPQTGLRRREPGN